MAIKLIKNHGAVDIVDSDRCPVCNSELQYQKVGEDYYENPITLYKCMRCAKNYILQRDLPK